MRGEQDLAIVRRAFVDEPYDVDVTYKRQTRSPDVVTVKTMPPQAARIVTEVLRAHNLLLHDGPVNPSADSRQDLTLMHVDADQAGVAIFFDISDRPVEC